MCSILIAMNQLKLHNDDSRSMTLSSEDDEEWCNALGFFARYVAYVAILGDESGDSEDLRAAAESETDPLWTEKTIPITYGTCEDDVETGSCSSGEDLYDARICIICYDEQRNCFFVPCGHCVTCYDCAQRIYDEESKVCPVCRRIIGKFRKLFAP